MRRFCDAGSIDDEDEMATFAVALRLAYKYLEDGCVPAVQPQVRKLKEKKCQLYADFSPPTKIVACLHSIHGIRSRWSGTGILAAHLLFTGHNRRGFQCMDDRVLHHHEVLPVDLHDSADGRSCGGGGRSLPASAMPTTCRKHMPPS